MLDDIEGKLGEVSMRLAFLQDLANYVNRTSVQELAPVCRQNVLNDTLIVHSGLTIWPSSRTNSEAASGVPPAPPTAGGSGSRSEIK